MKEVSLLLIQKQTNWEIYTQCNSSGTFTHFLVVISKT